MVVPHEMPSTCPQASAGAKTQSAVARARDDVLGGRGPGADQEEVERWTRQRLTLGAVSAPLARELLHLDTARARDRLGDDADAALECRRERTLDAWRPACSPKASAGRPVSAVLLAVAGGFAAGVLASRRGPTVASRSARSSGLDAR